MDATGDWAGWAGTPDSAVAELETRTPRAWLLALSARRGRVPGIALLFGVLAWPLASPPPDTLATAILACEYTVVAVSLVLLIGMVGQISLCQASLVGFGAFVAALGTQHAHLVFPLSVVVGVGCGAVAAVVIGAVALRVRGLFFAVATLIFAFVTDQYLFKQTWLVGSVSGTAITPEAIGHKGTAPYVNLADAHDFYYVALAGAVFALYAVANLRDARLGRAFAAVRGSEVAAASLGIDVVRTKLLAFAFSGGLAGLAGALLLVGSRAISPEQFDFTHSLLFLAVAVVGGLRSLGGAVASSLLFALLQDELFFRFPAASNYLDVISAVLLVSVLLFFRGGLGAIPASIRSLLQAQLAGRRAAENGETGSTTSTELDEAAETPEAGESETTGVGDDESASTVSAVSARMDPSAAGGLVYPAVFAAGDAARRSSRGRPLMLEASGIVVRFGGLVAVDGAAIEVDEGEIVGLIGPNGAGKTTLFNALLGLNDPVSGRVRIFGHDVTTWSVHKRAALGLGRTFQVLQLFPDLSVTDNLMAATHLKDSTGLFGGVIATRGALAREQENRARVTKVLAAMGLSEIAERSAGSLPFGVLRLVEVARTLVTGAPLVFLDEPASGLDSRETEQLIAWLQALREIGVTLLVIEHDVAMVTRLCDRIYVLDQGKLIATGTPEEIRADPSVIASYLGTSEVDAAEEAVS
jgi:sulfate-transporting ATPase